MTAPYPQGITRRMLAATALAPAAVAMQPPPAPADELAAVRQQSQRTTETLRKFKVPMATEPSFAFRP